MVEERLATGEPPQNRAVFLYNICMKRKLPPLKARRPQGRPMANGGIQRQNKRLRQQIRKKMQKFY